MTSESVQISQPSNAPTGGRKPDFIALANADGKECGAAWLNGRSIALTLNRADFLPDLADGSPLKAKIYLVPKGAGVRGRG